MMGGDLTVSSEVGVGTVFRLDIPIEVVDATEIVSVQPERRVLKVQPGQSACRILVADDVKASRTLLIKLLQPLGFELREAINGQETIDIWKEWHPHLIFMDIRMPVLDGREATRRIKATPQGQETIIVALTASAFDEDQEETLAVGCDDFVRKPFREAEIFDALTRHLGIRFVYEEKETSSQVGKDAEQEKSRAVALLPAALATMPIEWLMDLRQATLEGDLGQLGALIEQIKEQNPTLSKTLIELAHNFEHELILELIQQATHQATQTSAPAA
jgi:CheY-like chemotaxis protein